MSYVSCFDALRFANWLHNGQGSSDTENGAYTLLGGTPMPTNGASVTRKPAATLVLPSEDEWYKAAYFDPALYELLRLPDQLEHAAYLHRPGSDAEHGEL